MFRDKPVYQHGQCDGSDSLTQQKCVVKNQQSINKVKVIMQSYSAIHV